MKKFPGVRTFISLAEGLESYVGKKLTPERMLGIMRILETIRVGALTSSVRAGDNTRTQALYEGALPAGVRLYQGSIFGNPVCFVAEKDEAGKTERVLFHIIPRPRDFVSPSLPWMDDKGILKEKLKEAGLPCADGGVAMSEDEAVLIFNRVGRPVIAKPHSGSRGRHTTLDLRTEDEVRRAFRIGAQISPKVVIEAYLKGTVHRVTLVGGEPVAVARREYPHVLGDGIHTVRELVDIENAKPYRNGNHFRKIDIRHRAEAALRKQGHTFDSIPSEGEMVILNDKNSRLHGTLTEDVTDSAHPDNLDLFKRLGAVLSDPIVGVDFMIGDMKRSWRIQPDAGFLEVNSMPFIDVHHKVVSGKEINVAKYLWEEIFSEKYRV
jgi:D-alanine-D-alanine ligase-like ATP-grasp enzyme